MSVMRVLVASAVLMGGVLPGASQGLPPCRAGMEAPKVGGLNYPGTILAVDEDNGAYQVRHHHNQLVSWVSANDLRLSCAGVEPKPVTQAFFVGKWATFVPPTPHYEKIGTNDYLVVTSGAAAFPIEIKADGTYSWAVSNRPGAEISGRWRVLSPGEYKYGTKPTNAPVILLMKGDSDADWYVARKPANALRNVHQVHIERMDLGMTQSGTRMR